jgi:purine-binding chemotaxis protein CheW
VVPVTPVPTARAFVGNLINVRGRVVPPPTIDTRFVVLEIEVDSETTVVAILADKVYEVTHLDAVVSEEVPRVGTRWRPEFVRAIGRRNGQFVMVLDIGHAFASAEQVYAAEQ